MKLISFLFFSLFLFFNFSCGLILTTGAVYYLAQDTKKSTITPIEITTITVENGIVNKEYEFKFNVRNATSPIIWSAILAHIPAGLTFNTATGTLSGIPQTAGIYEFQVAVTDSNNLTDSQMFQLQIFDELKINTDFLDYVIWSKYYEFKLQASGGATPYLWEITYGNLPYGLNLSADGTISGTVTGAIGVFSIGIKCTDSNNSNLLQSETKYYNLVARYESIEIVNLQSELIAGKEYRIFWQTTGGIAYVNVELWKDNNKIKDIILNKSNNGYFDWQISEIELIDETYQIKIKSDSDFTVYAFSNFFSINYAIEINAINQKEIGESVNLTWNTYGNIAKVDIELWQNNIKQETITTETENNNLFIWTIPTDFKQDNNYQIFIKSSDNQLINCTSNDFEIVLSHPKNIKASPYSEKIKLEWDYVAGAISYSIYLSEEPEINFNLIAEYITLNSYEILNLINDKSYYLKIKCLNSYGESIFSEEICSIPFINVYTSVSCGIMHILAIRLNKEIWSWGYNSYGELGIGTLEHKNTPVKINLENVKKVSAGVSLSIALQENGDVWTWGCNNSGQLGKGDLNPIKTPNKININNIIDISTFSCTSVFLKNDGTVFCCGNGQQGEMGNGTNIAQNSLPVQVNINSVIKISSGGNHILALKNDGTVWAWGENSSGQLGDGTNINSNIPKQVLNLENIIEIAGGQTHSIALKNDGTVYVWGNNWYGELGIGTYENSNIPICNSYLSNISSIKSSALSSIFIKNDGTIYFSGYNNYGKFGNGNEENSNIPVASTGFLNVVLGGGGSYFCAILDVNGSIYTCGIGEYYILGNGTMENVTTPVKIAEVY